MRNVYLLGNEDAFVDLKKSCFLSLESLLLETREHSLKQTFAGVEEAAILGCFS